MDRRIKLYQPSGGAEWARRYTLYAERVDRGGRVTLDDDQRAGEWDSAFTIRAPIGSGPRVRADWRLVDEHGEQYTVTFVGEVRGSRGAKLRLFATHGVDAGTLTDG